MAELTQEEKDNKAYQDYLDEVAYQDYLKSQKAGSSPKKEEQGFKELSPALNKSLKEMTAEFGNIPQKQSQQYFKLAAAPINLLTAGAAKLGELATGKKTPVASLEDIKKINPLNPESPTSAGDYLEKLGVPPGPMVGLPNVGSVFGVPKLLYNSVVSKEKKLGPDAFKIPLRNLLAGGVQALADRKLGFMQGNAAKNATQETGENVYKSAPSFKGLDELSRQKGKIPVSDVLWRNKVAGTDLQVGQKAMNLVPKYAQTVDQIIAQIDEAGIKGNVKNAVSKGVEYAKSLADSNIEEEQAIGKALLNRIDKKYSSLFIRPDSVMTKQVPKEITEMDSFNLVPVTKMGSETIQVPVPGFSGASADEMLRLKRLSGGSISPSAWQKLTPAAASAVTKGQKIVGAGLKEELENIAGQVSPELRNKLMSTNADQSALLTAAKKLNSKAYTSAAKPHLGPVDAMVAGAGALGGDSAKHAGERGMAMLALKKVGDALKSTWLPTTAGVGMYQAGENIPFDSWLKQYFQQNNEENKQ